MLFALFGLFIIEGLGWIADRQILTLFSLVIPILGIAEMFVSRVKVSFPKVPLIIFGLLLIHLTVFSLASVNINSSIERWLLWPSGFVVMLYSYQYRSKVKKFLPWGLGLLSFVYVLYALWLNSQLAYGLFQNLIPKNGYNLFYSTYRHHNHLGDFLALVAIYSLSSSIFKKQPLWLIITLTTLPIIVFSYSRSSFLALIVVCLLLAVVIWRSGNRKLFWLILGISLSLGLVFLGVTREINSLLPWFSSTVSKPLFNGREHIWAQALSVLKAYPLTGVGLGNFIHASLRFGTIPYQWAYNSENIFLNILSEAGITSGLLFLTFVIVVVLFASKNSRFFYLFLTLLIIFQTDYIYGIISIWLLFCLLVGIQFKDKVKAIALPKIILPGIFLVLTSVVLMFNLHYFFLSIGQNVLAMKVYPFNRLPYQILIIEKLRDHKIIEAEALTRKYQQIAFGDVSVQLETAAFYLRCRNQDAALEAMTQAYLWHPFEDQLYKRLYYLESAISGVKTAQWVIKDYRKKMLKLPDNAWTTPRLREDFKRFIDLEKLNQSL